jgi:two-component system response regulator QseB
MTQPPSAPPFSLHPVLVVDDDESILRAVTAVIRRVAHTRTASSLAEARVLLTESREWLALVVDYAIGDGTGLDVVEEARRLHVRAPAILLTALTAKALRDRAAAAGVAYMEKPFEPEALRAFVVSAHDKLQN